MGLYVPAGLVIGTARVRRGGLGWGVAHPLTPPQSGRPSGARRRALSVISSGLRSGTPIKRRNSFWRRTREAAWQAELEALAAASRAL
jgi:hypothetical protein